MKWPKERLQIRQPLGLALLLVAFLVGCQTPPPAPVAERPQPPSQKILHHIVSRDETLYSIAWRYELDFQQLAAVNGLSAPYDLSPGQRLSLDMRRQPAAVATGYSVKTGVVTAKPVDETSVQGTAIRGVDVPFETESQTAPQTTASQPLPETLSKAPPAVKQPEQSPAGLQSPWQWKWPATGRVAKEYDVSNVLKGISIYTNSGTAVAAAAPGTVVYAGNGLRGYGNLVIVKHSEKHLSAYAHNSTLLVSENQQVRQGEKIAEVGLDASKQNRLYFEIRENGKPVDPLRLLPRQ
ncbi:MAG: peptidoglycan DD-metalloendopeptidase family protein [Porticoccaceae bacterium]|nr:peptidoglycan DD-metalloendopeptidase family protein [Porticoccaceae bacterium]